MKLRLTENPVWLVHTLWYAAVSWRKGGEERDLGENRPRRGSKVKGKAVPCSLPPMLFHQSAHLRTPCSFMPPIRAFRYSSGWGTYAQLMLSSVVHLRKQKSACTWKRLPKTLPWDYSICQFVTGRANPDTVLSFSVKVRCKNENDHNRYIETKKPYEMASFAYLARSRCLPKYRRSSRSRLCWEKIATQGIPFFQTGTSVFLTIPIEIKIWSRNKEFVIIYCRHKGEGKI